MQTRAPTERPCQGPVVVQLPLPLLIMLKTARGAVVARIIEKRHWRRIDIDRGHAGIPSCQGPSVAGHERGGQGAGVAELRLGLRVRPAARGTQATIDVE